MTNPLTVLTARQDISIWVIALLSALALALIQVPLAYLFSPLVAAALPPAAAIAAVIAWRPITGVYAAMLLVPLDLYQSKIGGDLRVSATEVTLLVTALAALGHVLLGRARRRALHPAHLAFLGLVAVSAAGMYFATEADITARISLLWVAVAAISMLVASSSPVEVERALMAIAVAGGVIGAIAFAGVGTQAVTQGGEVISNRAKGTFADPNVLAFFLVVALAPAVALSNRGAIVRRVLMLSCAVAMVLGLVFTLSRSGLIGAAVSLALLLTWAPFRRYALAGLGILAVVVVLNFDAIQANPQVNVVKQRFSTLTSGQLTRTNTRLEIWRKTPAMIADHPLLGVGAGNYENVSARYGLLDVGALRYDHAHNVFLTIGAELGLLGLALFLAFCWSVVRAGRRALAARDPRVHAMALALAAALAGLLVTSLAEYPPRTSSVMAAMMIEVGALLAYERSARDQGSPTLPDGGERTSAIALSGRPGSLRPAWR